MAESKRNEGTITRVIKTRGFAFVTEDDGTERFVHIDSLLNPEDWDSMKSGRRVSYVPIQTARGLRALDVTYVD